MQIFAMFHKYFTMCLLSKVNKMTFIYFSKTFLSGKYTVGNKRFGASTNDNFKHLQIYYENMVVVQLMNTTMLVSPTLGVVRKRSSGWF